MLTPTLKEFADSAAVYEYSYSTGTGSYELAGAYGGFFPFSDAYQDGATVYYRVTDGSSLTEFAIGTFNAAADMISRDTIIQSSNNGNPISWTGRTRLLIHAIEQGLPLCATPPMAGQALLWDAVNSEYCPGDVAPADVDIFIHRVTSGTIDSFLVLPAPQNIIIWSSATGGAKTQTIPSPSAYDSVILHVKMNPTVRGTLTISPSAGTIEEQSSIDIVSPDSVMLLGDGTAGNWVSL